MRHRVGSANVGVVGYAEEKGVGKARRFRVLLGFFEWSGLERRVEWSGEESGVEWSGME